MELAEIKQLDLSEFLSRHYDIRVNGNGGALCPFHDDKEPSLSVSQKNGIGLFLCHSCGAKGSILDFIMLKEGLKLPDAIRRIKELEGIAEEPRPAEKPKFEVVRTHSYTDENGVEVWQKIKLSDGTFRCRRRDGDRWVYNLKGVRTIPYRLPEFKVAPAIIICEGEKDATNLAALGYPTTSGPNGKDSWPDELTPMFVGKECRILYDVGQDAAARAVAKKLSAVCSHVFILKVPLPDHEADITDYLARFLTDDEKRDAFLGILAAEERFVPDPAISEEPSSDRLKPFEGTLGQFLLTEFPEPTPIIHDLLNQNEFMLLGGVKGSHKTTFMMNMGLAFASGRDFLGFTPARPGRFLMIQQELSEGEFRKRLRAAVHHGQFDVDLVRENFIPYTGTADPIKILEPAGQKRLEALFDKFKPDWIGLDPLSKFHRVNESDPRVWGEVRDFIHHIKVGHGAVVLSQPFTSKRPKDDPNAPAEAAGWFRGHTALSDSADVLFCLHRLPGQKNNRNLPRAFEDYNQVEIELRNGRWPARFATEMDETSFLITRSDVWHELGAKIELGNVREVAEAHGGQITLANLIVFYQAQFAGQGGVSAPTVKKAVTREVDAGYITTEILPGKGKPTLIRSREK